MDFTSKQRAQLRGLANNIDTLKHPAKAHIVDHRLSHADHA